jgi:hypothetical protein
MQFTFGIITSGNNDTMVNTIIDSIHAMNIPDYEIIIIGNSKVLSKNTTVYEFDETLRSAWITRKKNMVCELAKYENVVLLHDYVIFNRDWYSGFLKYGNTFKICTCKIIGADGKRFRDYNLFIEFVRCIDSGFENACLLPYDFKNNNRINMLMYISGAFYIIKKEVALAFPLDENKTWGYGEDVELSNRLARNNILIECNSNSEVHLLREKQVPSWHNEITNETLLNKLKEITETDIVKWKNDPRCFELFSLLRIASN